MTFGQNVSDEVDTPRSCRSLTMITPKLKANEERKKLIRICSQKLEKIKDPDINLRRSVCINNTYCRLRDEVRREKEFKYKSYDEFAAHDTDGSFLDKTIEVGESESNYRHDLMEICEEAAKDECEIQGSTFSLDLANAFKIRTRDDSTGADTPSRLLLNSHKRANDENKDYYVLRKLDEPNDSKQIVHELESIDKELEELPCFQPAAYQDLIPNVLLDVFEGEPKATKSLSNFETSFNAFCKFSYAGFDPVDSEPDTSSNDSIDDEMAEFEPSPKRLCLGLTQSNSCGDFYRQTEPCSTNLIDQSVFVS